MDTYTYIVLPVLIFLARIVDVSLATLRIIFISKGMRSLIPVVSFVEIFIWIIAISNIMENLNNMIGYVAYAGGFAAGSYIGMIIDEKIALGYELIRIITRKEASELLESLRNRGYGITSINASGIEGQVAVIYIIARRKNIKEAIEIIRKFNPHALYTIEDIRFVSKEVFYRSSKKKFSRRWHKK
jgi:uncharacterized protein YebE (UPF0316 family)